MLKAIIGKKKGDAFTITVKDAGKIVSSNYEGDDYKGKSAEVYVTINSAYNYVDHELTEEYVKEKFDCDSIDAFKKKIREDLEKETESDNAEAMKQDLFDKIVENAEIVLEIYGSKSTKTSFQNCFTENHFFHDGTYHESIYYSGHR